MLNRIGISSKPNDLKLVTQKDASTNTAQSTSNTTPASNTSTISGDQILSSMSLSAPNYAGTYSYARDILKKPPFAPTDVNMFSPSVYPESTPMEPAAPNDISETELKGQLTSMFAQRFNNNTSKINAAMALYNDSAIVKAAPDPRLRASLVALKGTPGEAAINAVKSGAVSHVQFYNFSDPSAIGGAQPDPQHPKKTIINISDRYQYEDFRLLSPTIGHESLHLDDNVNAREERMANTLDTMVYGKFILENPSLAQSGTELARRSNTKFMGRLNSRDANGNLRLYTAQGNIFPGSAVSVDNFADSFVGDFTKSSPGNAILKQEIKAETGVTLRHPGFNATTEKVLDQHQTLFTPDQLVQLANTLKLDTTS